MAKTILILTISRVQINDCMAFLEVVDYLIFPGTICFPEYDDTNPEYYEGTDQWYCYHWLG